MSKLITAALRQQNTEAKLDELLADDTALAARQTALQNQIGERVLRDAERTAPYSDEAQAIDLATQAELAVARGHVADRISLLQGAQSELSRQASEESVGTICKDLQPLIERIHEQYAATISARNELVSSWADLGNSYSRYKKIVSGDLKTAHFAAWPGGSYNREDGARVDGGLEIDLPRFRSALCSLRLSETPGAYPAELLDADTWRRRN